MIPLAILAFALAVSYGIVWSSCQRDKEDKEMDAKIDAKIAKIEKLRSGR
jgi:hypothetical protein